MKNILVIAVCVVCSFFLTIFIVAWQIKSDKEKAPQEQVQSSEDLELDWYKKMLND